MTDRTELRRLAELAAEASPLAKVTPFMDLTPQTVLALLDAAERADRAIGLLRLLVGDDYDISHVAVSSDAQYCNFCDACVVGDRERSAVTHVEGCPVQEARSLLEVMNQ